VVSCCQEGVVENCQKSAEPLAVPLFRTKVSTGTMREQSRPKRTLEEAMSVSLHGQYYQTTPAWTPGLSLQA